MAATHPSRAHPFRASDYTESAPTLRCRVDVAGSTRQAQWNYAQPPEFLVGESDKKVREDAEPRRTMKTTKSISIAFATCAIALTMACSDRPPKAPDVTANIRHSLDQAGLNDVSVSQDREKSVVTLTGNVGTDDDKARAESIARSIAGAEVVSNEIGVRPATTAPRRKLTPISTPASIRISMRR